MRISNLVNPPALADVFTPGGQPSVTYVDRAELGLESAVRKAIDQVNSIVSLTGATKTGKTVLCKNVLEEYEYVWIDGGQVKAEEDLWKKICSELRLPNEKTETGSKQTGLGGHIDGSAEASAGIVRKKVLISVSGSRLKTQEESATFTLDSMQSAIDYLTANKVILVIDDFHYLNDDTKRSVIQSLKGAVFRGLKVILLSTPHRAFEAMNAESEVTGRFKHVPVPDWSIEHLREIATSGFEALNVECPVETINKFATESRGSPLLMQQFCWNLCYDLNIRQAGVQKQRIPDNFNLESIFSEVAKDAGLPRYEKLAKGPQTRTERQPRPLRDGTHVDIYQAILLAIAMTGPKEKLTYDEIRSSLNAVLLDRVPQKIEVSNALNNLSSIDSAQGGGPRSIDWNQRDLELVIVDPFFSFYLRWEIAHRFRTSQVH